MQQQILDWSDTAITVQVPTYRCAFFGFEMYADTRETVKLAWAKAGGDDPGKARRKFKVRKPKNIYECYDGNEDVDCDDKIDRQILATSGGACGCPCDLDESGSCNSTDVDISDSDNAETYGPNLDGDANILDWHLINDSIELHECIRCFAK